MKTKKDITADIDLIIGKNNEVTDDTHMDLVDEISDYIASQQQVPQDREECCTNYKQYLLEQIKEKDTIIASQQHPSREKIIEVLEDSGELLNLFASKLGCQTEDAPLKSDAEDYGSLDLLRRIREVISELSEGEEEQISSKIVPDDCQRDCSTCKHTSISKYIDPCYTCRKGDDYPQYTSDIVP